jgi:hypothetical protein
MKNKYQISKSAMIEMENDYLKERIELLKNEVNYLKEKLLAYTGGEFDEKEKGHFGKQKTGTEI